MQVTIKAQNTAPAIYKSDCNGLLTVLVRVK
jgi:hypothetical protein